MDFGVVNQVHRKVHSKSVALVNRLGGTNENVLMNRKRVRALSKLRDQQRHPDLAETARGDDGKVEPAVALGGLGVEGVADVMHHFLAKAQPVAQEDDDVGQNSRANELGIAFGFVDCLHRRGVHKKGRGNANNQHVRQRDLRRRSGSAPKLQPIAEEASVSENRKRFRQGGICEPRECT
ncbi:hypothetical protein HDU87_001888 [Geranomyces variabilis]|uniref:Uncharacterized protein n=1 Tax=Geranomyces variabilis TaxID=109894 RepID=A0AAD5TCF3_9FUNG|nr:hypothetical protein HDU87_001888 [Geranomyces variabilis]